MLESAHENPGKTQAASSRPHFRRHRNHWHRNTRSTHYQNNTTNQADSRHKTTSPTNPAQLAADKAAYKASVALAAQLGATYDQVKQAEQAALDQYGDSSQQYQTAKATADTAYDAYQNQLADEAKKSLQVPVDGSNPKD